jgi:hypothetical protein
MSIKKATGNAGFAIQPVTSSIEQPAVGSLPTTTEVRPEVPEAVTQGDAYFSRESIGSAMFDSRMDFPRESKNFTPLKFASSQLAKRLRVSPERPTLLANVDIIDPGFKNPEAAKQAINETFEVAEFEASLLAADYSYVMDSLQQSTATSTTYSELEAAATSNFSDSNAAVESIQQISAASEKFSRNLDVRLSWDTVQEKIGEHYSSFSTRFGNGQAGSSLRSLRINVENQRGTDIVKRIEARVKGEAYTRDADDVEVALQKVIDKVKASDLLFDDGSITVYSKLDRLDKVAVCCEFLARVLNDTFNQTRGSADISMPTAYSGCNVFDPYPTIRGRERAESHYGIINDAVSSLSTSKIQDFKSAFVSQYTGSFERAKTKAGVSYPDEVGTPLDIYTRMFKYVAQSFQTVGSADEAGVISNPNEIYDAINLSYTMKRSENSEKVMGFFRGVILTTITDENFTLGYNSNEEFDSVTQVKSEISDTGGDPASRTVESKTGVKKLATNTLEVGKDIYYSVFQNVERVNNFPLTSRKYTSKLLSQMDKAASEGYEWYLPLALQLSPNSEYPEWQAGEVGYWQKNAPRCESLILRDIVPQGNDNGRIGTRDYQGVVEIIEGLIKSLQNFSRDDTGKTVANAIINLYNELISLFEEITGKSLAEVSPDGKFIVWDGSCTKRALIDVIIECIGNITVLFFKPGFYRKGDVTTTTN